MNAKHEETILLMKQLLTEAFSPSVLQITDESHKHIGHPGAQDGRGHFKLEIRSEQLAQLNSVDCHRKIYLVLGDLMQTRIHALTINVIKN